MIYSIQPNWFQDHIRPKAIRRAVVAFSVAVALLVSAWMLDSKAALAISVIAFLFGASDVVGLENTKLIVESLKVSVSDEGLTFIFGPSQTKVLYPWRSLSVTRIQHDGGVVKSFVVRDTSRKRSHVRVAGYESMSDLLAAVHRRISNA
jgi:hypothetical protein